MTTLELGRPVGDNHPPYIVAAVTCTKLDSVEHALEAIDIAAGCQVDAIKLTALPSAWCNRVFEQAGARGLEVITTVADERSIERLDWSGTSAFEIFFDWADLDLVACAARTGRPLVLSVANASEPDIAEALAVARAEGARQVALVQRVLGAGLDHLEALRRHDVVVGISDRSAGSGIVRAAIGRGARIVEKRLAPRNLSADLATVVRDCELAWALLGNAHAHWTTN